MKNKEFAIWPIFGIDFTSRKYYRRRLALNAQALKEQREAIDNHADEYAKLDEMYRKQEEQLEASRNVAKNAVNDAARLKREIADQKKAYMRLAGSYEELEKELIEQKEEYAVLNGAYLDLKTRLQKYDRRRGKSGRFTKQQEQE